MTGTTGRSVRSLLPPKWRDLDEIARQRMDETPWAGERPAPRLLMGFAGEQATAALQRALDRDVFDYFVAAWQAASEIRACAEQSAREPGIAHVVTLGEHELSTTLRPVVHVDIDGLGAFDIPFDLALGAGFHTARLTLRGGALCAVDAGDCDVAAQLSYEGTPLHEKWHLQKVALGAPLRFDPPLPLVRASTHVEHRHG